MLWLAAKTFEASFLKDLPVLNIVWQLVELPQPPCRKRRPAPGSQRAWAVVKPLSIAEKKVDEQEDQQEGRQ